VSPRAGTTRDVIEARLELGGVAVTLLDTAGLHDTDDVIELEGMRRARDRAASADLIIFVHDARVAASSSPPGHSADAFELTRRLTVANKIDLVAGWHGDGIEVSARTGEGIDRLRDTLREVARSMTTGATGAPLTRARHRAALQRVVEHLGAGYTAPLIELRAEDVRLAVATLGRITGRVGVEDILDSVFSQFCIGK
jgi:tRNA modification GTPase